MAGVNSENPFNRCVWFVARPLGELVHVAAVYLGIAALVTLTLGLTIPSVRSQMQQVHVALLAALQPESLQDDASGIDADVQYDLLSRAADEATSAAPGTAPGPNPVSSAYFVRALKASAKGLDIDGVSSAQAQALRSYIARKYKIASTVAGVIIKTAFQVGRRKGLDPQLILAVIAIESRYNPYAESHVGAQGLMQVMTKVHIEKFDPFGEGAAAALNPIANIRVGTQILHDCIKRRGSVKAGLACYVGATGPGDGGYGAKVLAEQRRIALASGIPIDNG